MKIYVLCFSILLCTALSGRERHDQPKASQAEIKFEESYHSFGLIKKGDPCEHFFKFKNTGNEPLIIHQAMTSCGCDVASAPREPILPGQTATIRYKYDSNRVGPFTKSMTITTNAKTTPTVVIIACGMVYSEEHPVKTYTNCNCGLNSKALAQAPIKPAEVALTENKTASATILPLTMQVYPNPFYDQTTIYTNKELNNASLIVYNMSGELVKELRNISGNEVTLSREGLGSGLYFICLKEGDNILLTKKVIVSR